MLHCNNTTTLEDFSDGVLVENKPSNRLDGGEVETSMYSDQVGFVTLNGSHLQALSSAILVCSFMHELNKVYWSTFSASNSLNRFLF